MDAKALLDDLNRWLAEHDRPERVSFSAPVTLDECRRVESALGVELPRAYTHFVQHHGTFRVPGGITGRGAGNDTMLYSPAGVMAETLKRREEFAEGDEEEYEIVADGLFFCADPLGEYFHLFVTSSADASGEMKTRGYDYQDPANNDPWYPGDGSFESTVKAIVEAVRRHAA